MKIVLVNPPFVFPHRKDRILSHCLGLRYISSYLKQGGHEVLLLDALKEGFNTVRPFGASVVVGLTPAEISERIPADTELVGISAPFSLLAPLVHELVAEVKQRYPGMKVVMGGVYPSTQPELALKSGVDYIIVGEGETVLSRIAEGSPAESLQGVYPPGHPGPYPAAEMIAHLDQLPFPDYDIPEISAYFLRSPRQHKGELTASVITSRGCPYACRFCSVHPVYGRGWRGRSADNVLAELDLLAGKYGVTAVEFEDDNITLDHGRAAEIVEGLIKRREANRALTWATPNGVRIDTLDEELIKQIVRSGCREIVLALEHGDQEMLTIMDKRLDLDRALDVIRLLVMHGMPRIIIFVIVGYPGETEARFNNSLRVLRKIRSLGGNIAVCANLAQPYPGTDLFRQCEENGFFVNRSVADLFDRNHILSTNYSVSIVTPDFSAADVLRRLAEIQAVFDGRVRTVLKRIEPLKKCVRAVRGYLN